MALTLNEQFALRAYFQYLNFLKYYISELTSRFLLSKSELQEIEALRKEAYYDSLLFHGFYYRVSGVSHVFYGKSGDAAVLYGYSHAVCADPFPYGSLDVFAANTQLYTVALVLYKAAENNFAPLSFAQVLEMLGEAVATNEVLGQIAHADEILKVFLTMAPKLQFLEREDLFFFKATLAYAYYYVVNKYESDAFPCLINPSFTPLAPGRVFSNFNQFDFYLICSNVGECDVAAMKQLLVKAFSTLNISNAVAVKREGSEAHFYVQYATEFTAFRLFRGPLVTENAETENFKALFGDLADFRRFSTGEMRICIFFEEYLSKDQIAELIARHVLSMRYKCDYLRFISTNSFYAAVPASFMVRRRENEISERIQQLREFMMVANSVHGFQFIISDVALGGYELTGNPAVLNGFLRVSGNGEWYYSVVGNQLLKALILDRIRETLRVTGDFSLEYTSTHIIARFQLPDQLVEAHLFIVTDADDVIMRAINPAKADFMRSLMDAKVSEMRLVTTLMSVRPGYQDGVRLAYAFIESCLIPIYHFQPTLADFAGVFATPPFVRLYNRFQELAEEHGLAFEQIFTAENMLEGDLREALAEAEQIGRHYIENMYMSHIGTKEAVSAELICLICALPFCQNAFNIEIPVPRSGIAVFRQFLKFFCFSQARKFELNCALDETMPVTRFIKIAIQGDPEGALFGNISEQLYNRIGKNARTALNWIDRCISGEQLWEGAIFGVKAAFDYIFTFADEVSFNDMEIVPLACLKGNEQYDEADPELLRYLIPDIIAFCYERFEICYSVEERFVGLRRREQKPAMRVYDLPDDLLCMKNTDNQVVFDEQRFLEEVIVFIGPAIRKLYCTAGRLADFEIVEFVDEPIARSSFYNFHRQLQEESFEYEEEK